MTKTMQTVKD